MQKITTIPWHRENVGICYEYNPNQLIHDWWLLNIRAFEVQAYERNSSPDEINRDKIIQISQVNQLPKTHELIVITPQDAEEIKGQLALHEFAHPQRAIYFFGSDNHHLKKEELPQTKYTTVHIPLKENFWAPQAATIVLYDRLFKAWQS